MKHNKTKYKLNTYKLGTIYADTALELIWKIITKKYVKNAYNNNSSKKAS